MESRVWASVWLGVRLPRELELSAVRSRSRIRSAWGQGRLRSDTYLHPMRVYLAYAWVASWIRFPQEGEQCRPKVETSTRAGELR